MRNLFFAILCLSTLPAGLFAQSTDIPLNRDYHHLIDRFEIKYGGQFPGLFSTMKPIKRQHVSEMVDVLLQDTTRWDARDLFLLRYLAEDNWEYSKNSSWNRKEQFWDFVAFRQKKDLQRTGDRWFKYHLNPVLMANLGTEPSAGANLRFMSTTGFELRSSLFDKVAFYGYFGQNFSLFPEYVQDRITEFGAIPMEGYWDSLGTHGQVYATPRFQLSAPVAKFVDVQMGFDRLFIGNGHRSMILSDFANNYFYVRANAKLGHFNYTMIQSVMRADVNGLRGESIAGSRYPRKYQAFHRLGIDIGKKLNIGVFETVVYGRERDNGRNPIELGYMVPAIFFRATEQQVGSADNALLGLDFSWYALPGISTYGQVMLDEFVLDELTSGEGWWANKWGVQAGLKFIDLLGVSHLDLQLEGNISRPFNYTHQNNFNSYTHFLQPLAHPFGANFREALAVVRYRPIDRLELVGRGIFTQFGSGSDGLNWGQDITEPYTTRVQDYGNTIGQGVKTNVLYTDITASYMVKHNVFFDFRAVFRDYSSAQSFDSNVTLFTHLGLRVNMPHRDHDF